MAERNRDLPVLSNLDSEVLPSDLPSRSPADDEPPRIEGYRIVGVLGRGGMATVYRAEDGDGAPLALKVLRATPEAPPKRQVLRFEREAAVLSRLKHPHVVRLRGAGRSRHGDWFLALELAERGDLLRRIEARGPVAAPAAVRLAVQLARAAAAAHALGVIHRDIKPQNVLLGDDDAPILTDFGLAMIQRGRRLTARNAVVGTRAYMSPEQWSPQAQVDERTDVFCLGATLHHMLGGRAPFGPPDRTTRAETPPLGSRALLLADSPPPRLEGVCPWLTAIVERCLAPRPALRFPTALALAEALERYSAGRE